MITAASIRKAAEKNSVESERGKATMRRVRRNDATIHVENERMRIESSKQARPRD